MEAKKLFSITMLDILDFKPEDVKYKSNYGYLMGKSMIEKCQNDQLFDGTSWVKPEGHQYYILSKEEEQKVKEEVATWN